MANECIVDLPESGAAVRLGERFGRRFIVTVDTEEEFDWGRPLARTGHTLHSVPRLARFQSFCESFGVVPIYLIDYPVATCTEAAAALRDAVAAGRAEVGVQLHPWVSPPHDEDICEFNSFAGNLPEPLERAKLLHLRDAIERNFGKPPLIYRAGRYGTGPHTAEILHDAGIAIDTSVRARFDYSSTGGPNYRDFPVTPFWIGKPGRLLELPLTTVYWGALRRIGHWLYPRMWRVPRLRGALARIGLFERIPLTPEGVTAKEAQRGIEAAIEDDLPLLVFSFHSPSLAPGHTPYVRTEADLDAFYDWWRDAFALLKRHNVAPTSVSEIMDKVVLATRRTPG